MNEEKVDQIVDVEVNQEMINEDIELQENGSEEDLVQDTFNEDGLNELMDEGSVTENVSSEEN